MINLNYYAKLNNEGVCEQIISTPKVIKLTDYIPLDNFNDTLLWRKWENGLWSEKRYIPEIDPVIQDKLDTISQLESIVEELKKELEAKNDTVSKLKNELSILSDTVDFLITRGDEVNG